MTDPLGLTTYIPTVILSIEINEIYRSEYKYIVSPMDFILYTLEVQPATILYGLVYELHHFVWRKKFIMIRKEAHHCWSNGGNDFQGSDTVDGRNPAPPGMYKTM